MAHKSKHFGGWKRGGGIAAVRNVHPSVSAYSLTKRQKLLCTEYPWDDDRASRQIIRRNEVFPRLVFRLSNMKR